MTSSAVDTKDLDPDLEHEKSVPTMEALLALNLKGFCCYSSCYNYCELYINTV